MARILRGRCCGLEKRRKRAGNALFKRLLNRGEAEIVTVRTGHNSINHIQDSKSSYLFLIYYLFIKLNFINLINIYYYLFYL